MNLIRRCCLLATLAGVLAVSGRLCAEQRFPPPDFESPYKLQVLSRPPGGPAWGEALDVGLLLAALSAATWIALVKRSRKWMVALSIACLAYFGFVRGGCVCPIGAIQNVTRGVFDSSYHLPLTVIAFFVLPLVFAALAGRVFCGGVCPLGAIQDLVLIKPVRVPRWLAKALGTVPYVYLGVAVLLAATDAMFVICRFDPFVPFFRMSGSFHMFIAGGAVLVLSTFVGRPYCRFACPYGAILGTLSRVSVKHVTITPDECVVCGLCEDACPFGSIELPNVSKEDES